MKMKKSHNCRRHHPEPFMWVRKYICDDDEQQGNVNDADDVVMNFDSLRSHVIPSSPENN